MAGVKPDPREIARMWAIRTCQAQGLEVKIAAAGVLSLVVVNLTVGKDRPSTASKRG